MAKGYKILSTITIVATVIWFFTFGIARHPVQWHFLAVAGVHFILSIIINRQFIKSQYNYLGIIHGFLMVSLGFYGYFFLA